MPHIYRTKSGRFRLHRHFATYTPDPPHSFLPPGHSEGLMPGSWVTLPDVDRGQPVIQVLLPSGQRTWWYRLTRARVLT
jgi:hypothetical protein